MSNTVLLIHGAWLNSRSWDAVKARYEAKGFTVVAPDWLGTMNRRMFRARGGV